MRRFLGPLMVCALALGASSARGQDVLGADVAGFGPKGVSNGLGYRMRQLGMKGGYWTPLYFPSDAGNGPSPYYLPAFSSINGAPRPDASDRGWGYSPPWSAAYRQGHPRETKLVGRLLNRHKS